MVGFLECKSVEEHEVKVLSSLITSSNLIRCGQTFPNA